MTIAAPIGASPVRAPNRVRMLGMGVDVLDRPAVAERLHTLVRSGEAHQVVTVNLDFLSVGTKNPDFRALVNDASLVVPDGMPVLWTARRSGATGVERVTGPDLIEMAVDHSRRHGSSLFFLGAQPGVAQRAAERLRQRLGEFSLAGAYAPPFHGAHEPAEDAKIRKRIKDARPDFLFVAFGCPRQDFWIRDHLDLAVPVSAGIGGSFDLLSGAIRRAPKWVQRAGFEWAFRLGHEPRRLAKRYLIDDVQVLGKLLLSRFTGAHEAPRAGDGG